MLIRLNRHKDAIIDDNMYPYVCLYRWYYHSSTGYVTTGYRRNGRVKFTSLHQYIYICMYGEIPKGMVIDHRNGDKLDNRLENLRMVTSSYNSKNRDIHRNGKRASVYEGVSYEKATGKWQAYIRINGKQKGLGRFSTEIEAYEARRLAELNLL